MRKLKTALVMGAFVGIVGAAAVAGSAAADVACNRWGECWRVRDHYANYPGNLSVIFHDEAWRARHMRGHWRWRHDRDDDHGYYNHGRWHRF